MPVPDLGIMTGVAPSYRKLAGISVSGGSLRKYSGEDGNQYASSIHVLPDTQLITRTVFETRDIPALLKEGYALSLWELKIP